MSRVFNIFKINQNIKIISFLIFIIAILTYILYPYIYKSTNSFTINYKIKITENRGKNIGEIFVRDINKPYKQSYQIRYKKKSKKKFQYIKFNIQNIENICCIRLDPLLSKGEVEVKDFTVKYDNQIHKVDFSKITNNNSIHNVLILNKNKNSIKLKCIGDDPYLEIDKNIDFKVNKYKKLFYSLAFSVLIVGAIYLFYFITLKYSLEIVLLIFIITVYSWYAILFSGPFYARNLLILFALIAIYITIKYNFKEKKQYLKSISIFLISYIIIAYLSIFFTTKLANIDYLNHTMVYIIIASLIPIAFFKIKNFDYIFFKRALTILLISMAIFILLLNFNIITIDGKNFFGFIMHRTKWTQKNYMFWYLLLMFGTISFYNIKNKIDSIIILILLLISYLVLKNGESYSARVAYILGVSIYAILSLFKIKKKYLLIMIWLFALYVIFIPLIFSLIDLSPYHSRLIKRNIIYHTAVALIKQNWLFGYGYGSTLTLHIKDFLSSTDLPKHYINTFPGGHPHNLALLFWLEFGVIGAVFLGYFIHKLLEYIINQTYNTINQAALLAMVIAFEFITSFSWSIWYYQVLLTFSFFAIMLVLSMNIKNKRS